MLKSIRQLWAPKEARPLPAIPPGERVYAIGDIHGRLDLFTALAGAVENDDAARGAAETRIILLGDLVDRGHDSAGVVQRVAELMKASEPVRLNKGNHEQVLVKAAHGSQRAARGLLEMGGYETLASYGIDQAEADHGTLQDLAALIGRRLPADHVALLDRGEDKVVLGDYLFVHAGIRPGEPLQDQSVRDMRWIREPFLSHDGDHEHVVVHGHTNTAEPAVGRNRIGIDTGAYMSGRLTALGLEGERRWLIEAEERDGEITVATWAV
jgi:serine/threonine protein phosphatase 1